MADIVSRSTTKCVPVFAYNSQSLSGMPLYYVTERRALAMLQESDETDKPVAAKRSKRGTPLVLQLREAARETVYSSAAISHREMMANAGEIGDGLEQLTARLKVSQFSIPSWIDRVVYE